MKYLASGPIVLKQARSLPDDCVTKIIVVMADYLLDTNVLSKIYYGDAKLKKSIDRLDAGVNAVIYIECIQDSIKKKDKGLIINSLDQLNFYPLTPETSFKPIELIDKYSASRGLFLADALIAATAIISNLTLITYNLKDFDFIKGLSVIQPNLIFHE